MLVERGARRVLVAALEGVRSGEPPRWQSVIVFLQQRHRSLALMCAAMYVVRNRYVTEKEPPP
jgi:hypothetical protein